MKYSYWEQQSWFAKVDYTIIGSGIVGLNCALRLREKFPDAKILVLEKGILPQGASTKNAGFACFGSISEILNDLKTHTEDQMVTLVKQRIRGLSRLKTLLGGTTIDYQVHGGYELFTTINEVLYDHCIAQIQKINTLLYPVFNQEIYRVVDNHFGLQSILPKLIFNPFEGQIDTGKMMKALLNLVYKKGIDILNATEVLKYTEGSGGVEVVTNHNTFITKKVFIATNGFASLLGIPDVKPARAQVFITEPIANLHIKGTFHLDQGYYYFRNINNRLLLGGGRNLDYAMEETTEMGETTIVQNELERLLKEVILPHKNVSITQRWSGIMGVGTQKEPIIKALSDNVFCGVRLGGMGVAIGSIIGSDLADLIS